MKRPNFARTVFGVGLLLALGGSAAQAQSSKGTFRATPESGNSRKGVEVRPQQPSVVIVPGQTNQPVFPRQSIAFIMIPALLMSDGTVLADFGMGYEPVTRSCGNAVIVSSELRIIAGNGVVLSPGPTYMQPVPNQQTATQQQLSAQSRYPILTAASQAACFSRDGSGRVLVVRQ